MFIQHPIYYGRRSRGSSRLMKRSALVALALSLAVILAPSSGARSSDCNPVRAVFYTSSDWLRLAQGLSADASQCASYYVTVPALAADKTQMVNNRASAVRALGLHAAAGSTTRPGSGGSLLRATRGMRPARRRAAGWRLRASTSATAIRGP